MGSFNLIYPTKKGPRCPNYRIVWIYSLWI